MTCREFVEFLMQYLSGDLSPGEMPRIRIVARLALMKRDSTFSALVLRCLAKNARDRFQEAGTLEKSFGRCAAANHWGVTEAARWWQTVGENESLRQHQNSELATIGSA